MEPTHPREIPFDTPLDELVDRAHRHGLALLYHRHGVEALSDADRAGHAVGQLVYSAALAERARSGRWVVACEALDAGASHEQVAAAMGLDVDELAAGLRSWARGQLRQGLISAERHAEVLGLLGEQGPAVAGDPVEGLPTWQLRRLVALVDALGDPPLTHAQRASLAVVAAQDQATVEHLAEVIRAARLAMPVGDRAAVELLRELDELDAETPPAGES